MQAARTSPAFPATGWTVATTRRFTSWAASATRAAPRDRSRIRPRSTWPLPCPTCRKPSASSTASESSTGRSSPWSGRSSSRSSWTTRTATSSSSTRSAPAAARRRCARARRVPSPRWPARSGTARMRQDVVDRVDAITREKIAPRASRYDSEGKNPVESWADLYREGYLACAVPAAYGGMGLDMATYAAVIRTIARGCASTAMTVHMHSTVMRFIDALGTDQQKRRYYAEVVERGKMFGSWGSEPAVSLSRTFFTETTVRVVDGGFEVDGVKYFCTMALGASYYRVWCALDGSTDMATSLVLAMVPAESPGISTDGKWDTLGMRATFSPSVTLSKVRIPPDATLGAPGLATGVGVIEGFALGYAAVYVGIAEAALEFTADYVKKRVVRPEN